MKAIQFTLGSLVFLAFFAYPSKAQIQRTFVSGVGSDINPCSRLAPCRTFAQAVSQTAAGGEVVVLDSAGYGPFNIAQAISIVAPSGVYAGISVISDVGISISAGASDTVVLRGITLNNQQISGTGIAFLSGGTLHVENCVANGPRNGGAAVGIQFTGPGNLEVKDSIARGNAHGIVLGSAVATLDRVRLEGNVRGLVVNGDSKVTVADSLLAGNADAGLLAYPDSIEVNIERCVLSNNTNAGIRAAELSTGSVTIRISNSTVTGNGIGLENIVSTSVILSRVNNTVEGNTSNTSGTIGTYAAK